MTLSQVSRWVSDVVVREGPKIGVKIFEYSFGKYCTVRVLYE